MVGWIWPKGPSLLTSALGKQTPFFLPKWQLCLVFLLICPLLAIGVGQVRKLQKDNQQIHTFTII